MHGRSVSLHLQLTTTFDQSCQPMFYWWKSDPNWLLVSDTSGLRFFQPNSSGFGLVLGSPPDIISRFGHLGNQPKKNVESKLSALVR